MKKITAWRVPPASLATIDMDATLIHAATSEALRCYQGFASYQPLNVYWAQRDLFVHTEFRDGNVPAGHQQLRLFQESLKRSRPVWSRPVWSRPSHRPSCTWKRWGTSNIRGERCVVVADDVDVQCGGGDEAAGVAFAVFAKSFEGDSAVVDPFAGALADSRRFLVDASVRGPPVQRSGGGDAAQDFFLGRVRRGLTAFFRSLTVYKLIMIFSNQMDLLCQGRPSSPFMGMQSWNSGRFRHPRGVSETGGGLRTTWGLDSGLFCG